MSTQEPSIVVTESEKKLFDSHLEASAELNELCQSLVQRAPSRSLAALFEGLQSRIFAVSAEAGSLVEWLTIAQEEVAAEPAVDPAVMERARTTKSRFTIKRAAAGLQADIADKKKWGTSSKSDEKKLGQLLHDNANTLGADIVKLLSQNDHFSWQGWKDLAEAYRLLEQEAGRIEDGRPAQPEKIAAAVLKHGALIEGTKGPKQDVDVDWLRGFVPGDAKHQLPPDELATGESLVKAAAAAARAATSVVQPVVPSKPYAVPIERCRLKADVARVKARIERAELLDQVDAAASAELNMLFERHSEVFKRDGYVFGFSVEHRMDPADWERLSTAYNEMALAWEAGFGPTLNARKCLAAVEALKVAIKPAGIGLTRDDDADLLKKEVKRVHPTLKVEKPDAFQPFASAFADLPDSVVEVADLAEEALTAGVKASDPRLRDPLIDWYGDLVDLDRGYLRVLLREVGKEIHRQQAAVVEEEQAEPSPEHSALLAKVRKLTRGKVMLMVGGANREENRQRIEQALALKELVWPESDEKMTKPADFDVHVHHADIVMKNRFCRRGYQRALKLASDLGKPTFVLPAGYNASQVVRAIVEQAHLD